jgi:hypothetical protein
MRLNAKDYKIIKTKEYLKTNKLVFFVNGIDRNSLDWLLIEQGLKTVGLSYYRVLNKTIRKTLDSSTYNSTRPVISGSSFVIKLQTDKYFLKRAVLNTFNLLFFELLIVKLNHHAYSMTALENAYSFKYKETKLLFYKFTLTHLKACSIISK